MDVRGNLIMLLSTYYFGESVMGVSGNWNLFGGTKSYLT